MALNVVGGFLVLAGTIWFLQGINILPGSFMTGQTRWAVIGGATFCVGLAVLVLANRHRRTLGRPNIGPP
jgi:hypothetical protein